MKRNMIYMSIGIILSFLFISSSVSASPLNVTANFLLNRIVNINLFNTFSTVVIPDKVISVNPYKISCGGCEYTEVLRNGKVYPEFNVGQSEVRVSMECPINIEGDKCSFYNLCNGNKVPDDFWTTGNGNFLQYVEKGETRLSPIMPKEMACGIAYKDVELYKQCSDGEWAYDCSTTPTTTTTTIPSTNPSVPEISIYHILSAILILIVVIVIYFYYIKK